MHRTQTQRGAADLVGGVVVNVGRHDKGRRVGRGRQRGRAAEKRIIEEGHSDIIRENTGRLVGREAHQEIARGTALDLPRGRNREIGRGIGYIGAERGVEAVGGVRGVDLQ